MKLFVSDKGFYKSMMAICLPIALQSLINIGVNMLDTVMLGVLGDTPLSASSLANQVFFFYMILHFGISGGIGVLASQYWGKGDVTSINKALSLGLQLSLFLSLLFASLATLMPETLMRIFTNEEEVIREGIIYMRWSAFSYLISGATTLTLSVLRSVGTVKIALYIQSVSLLVNLVLNYVLIFGRFGFPEMGIAGAALATVIARLVEFVWLLLYMAFLEKKIRFQPKYLLRFDKNIFRSYLDAGVAVLVSDALLAAGGSCLTMIMGRMGQAMVAANSIASVVFQLSTVLSSGFASAGSVLTGNTVGRGEYQKAKEQGVTMVAISVAFGLLAASFILLLRPFIVNFYDNVSAEAKDIAWQLLDVQAFLVIFSLAGGVLTKGVLRGGGDTKFLMVADVIFLWVISVPLGALAGLVWGAPAGLVFLCLKSDEIIKAVWCAFRLAGNKWIKNVTV